MQQRERDIVEARIALNVARAHHFERAHVDPDVLARLTDAAEGHPYDDEIPEYVPNLEGLAV